ncbi:hypothetical protein SCAB_16511 [Streptomyces scabiei 87.22]|uniref:Uncharacterized protein n=1 Tax=Streptomyces scabiei (strain 87.22) TaxID=680198 RepID=C9ZD58_STRSW|nr:hypothetical protein SCAB_16511 [Streptomyces scabiei 87.22]
MLVLTGCSHWLPTWSRGPSPVLTTSGSPSCPPGSTSCLLPSCEPSGKPALNWGNA